MNPLVELRGEQARTFRRVQALAILRAAAEREGPIVLESRSVRSKTILGWRNCTTGTAGRLAVCESDAELLALVPALLAELKALRASEKKPAGVEMPARKAKGATA